MKWWIAASFLLAFGCRQKRNAASNAPAYYNAEAALREHVQTMFKQNAYMVKYVTYNGKSDQVINRKPDWNKELKPFYEAGIHAPSLSGMYSVDSIRAADGTLQLTYKTTEENAVTKNMVVRVDANGGLVSLNIERQTGSLLNVIHTNLRYDRFREFRVEVNEDNKYSQDVFYKVIGEIHMEAEYFK